MVKVVKFGGSSLSDSGQFKKVKDIILSDNTRKYVVVSAPGKRYQNDNKITDLLFLCFNNLNNKSLFDEYFNQITQRYAEIIKELNIDFDLDKEISKIRTIIENYSGCDYITSRGEYLNAKIFAKYLGYNFVDSENNIYFDSNGQLDMDKTQKVLGGRLSYLDNAVIPGFYGSLPNGTIKTFSRGGSDITGSIVASVVDADLYENWTDVSGMLMADPRIVDNPKPIDIITYAELRELSYMGASVMHEDAIFPVRQSGIPINIKNTNSPADKGTMIVPYTDTNSENIIDRKSVV